MIKFATWNLENFFITPSLKYPHRYLKDAVKVEKIASVIQKIDPDFIFLTEVGGLEDLKVFNEKYLDSNFQIFFKKGNSNRGIELAFMAKTAFLESNELSVNLKSHAKSPINFHYPHEIRENKKALEKGYQLPHRGHKMSRDLLQVEVCHKSDPHHPLFILLGVHFKSKLDKDAIDWNGQRRRQAECRFSAEVYEKLDKRHHHRVPIFLTGDFNGEAHHEKRDPEFRDLYALELQDFGEVLDLPIDHRYTFIGMDRSRQAVGLQLDYFFMRKEFTKKIIKSESGFYRYSNDAGEVYPIPQNPGAKFALPSDHYPIVISFEDDTFSKKIET